MSAVVAVQQLDLLMAGTEQALRARDAGIDRVLASDDSTAYRDQVLGAIEILAIKGEPFIADDVRDLVGDPLAWVHPNLTGAVFMAAARAGLIRQVGQAVSRRGCGHGNRVVVWIGVEQ